MRRELIEVKYRNSRRGFVDDVTLNELILSHKIEQFYRPSRKEWIDIETNPVRIRESEYGGPERRAPDKEEVAEQLEEKPHGLLSSLIGRSVEPIAQKKVLTAKDWFEMGFLAMHTVDDNERTLRAFAKAIHLDPAYQRAYLNRGIIYDRLGNLQQAIDDYSKAIELAPGEAMVYYVRGLARKRLGMGDEAMEDLGKAARMGYRQAVDFCKSKRRYL